MSGQTRKWQSLRSDAGPILASSRTVTEAAKRLRVSRDTIHRWIKAGLVSRPGGRPKAPRATTTLALPSALHDWAEDIRARYALSTTETMLLRLAEEALALSLDATQKASDRLAATSRFQSLVRQLNLEAEDGETEARPDVRTYPRRVS